MSPLISVVSISPARKWGRGIITLTCQCLCKIKWRKVSAVLSTQYLVTVNELVGISIIIFLPKRGAVTSCGLPTREDWWKGLKEIGRVRSIFPTLICNWWIPNLLFWKNHYSWILNFHLAWNLMWLFKRGRRKQKAFLPVLMPDDELFSNITVYLTFSRKSWSLVCSLQSKEGSHNWISQIKVQLTST